MTVYRNTDSLEKAILKQLIISKEYINDLIWLEMTYRDRNIKFGSNIVTIGRESKSQKYELGTAMY